ncbi:MAG TPA: MEDS domain-containing protein [Candidatus Dormibacteraeota bacterium]|jgi:MEDS: MEthanogen/methylotroph, DcmR Sensory domain|nr:MEDS domain-containing protein [Candidatus Dormibacteraeota bacterium]
MSQNAGPASMLEALTELGIGDIVLSPGDHICAFYYGAAGRDELLIPYLAEGLRTGEKCLCFVDVADRRQMLEHLRPHVSGWDSTLADEQLDVFDFKGSYLRDNRFSQEEMFHFLDQRVGAAVRDQGFPLARAAGEMTWALRTCPGVEELCAYEAKINVFAPRYPQILLCLYDLERFTGEVIVDVLKTHPKVLIGNMVIENPFYVEPDEFLARHRTGW